MDESHWKCVGTLGAALFAARWLLQAWASKRAGRPVTTRSFWICSLMGSGLLLVYFAVGPRRDSVGLLGNVLPAVVASYNLVLARRRTSRRPDAETGPAQRSHGVEPSLGSASI